MGHSREFRVRSFAVVALFSLFSQGVAPTTLAAGQRHFLVTDFGARGKADQKDTVAFQKVVDECHAAGGGVIDVPPGTYRLGRVVLRDNVTVNLEAGTVLRPSIDRADYPTIAGAPDSRYQPDRAENALSCRFAILYAFRARNIAVVGRGKMIGDAKSFWKPKATGDFPKWNAVAPQYYFTPNAFRPMMVLFEDCENAAVRDVTIEDSPCYSGWFAGCRYLNIANVSILNDLAGPNTDGFHFSSCRNVHVTDCDFVCGDDCIAIDPNHRGPSCNFTITGCTFKTSVNAFRIYTGLDPGLPPDMPRGRVTDVSASNCSVEDASGVFNITAERGDIQRVAFSNFSINMDYRGSAFFFLTIAGGGIQDIALGNMTIRTDGAGVISGEGGGNISRITLDNMRYEMFPRTKLFGNAMPEPFSWPAHHFAPYNLYIRHAEDVTLHNIQVSWREADLADLDKISGGKPSWSCIDCYDVSGLDIGGVVCSPYGGDSPAIRLNQVNRALISGCRAQPGTKVFVQVAGHSENISLIGNDLSEADTICKVTSDIAPAVVFEAGNRAKPTK
jgi:hypothetical protein